MRLIIEARLEGYDIERTVVPIPLGRVNSHGFARSQLPITNGIRYIPTHAPKDDVPLELAAFEIHDRHFAV